VAEFVCNVENTRCPVSARFKTASAVSLFLISHTKMTSGSSLRVEVIAAQNDRVS
jgi:hypothetical protein